MQIQTILAWKKSQIMASVASIGFAILWKCSLFFDELEKYDRMSKAMRREDRWQGY